jgi:hypothetical protein
MSAQGKEVKMPELKLLFLQMAVILATVRLMAVAFRFVANPR